MAQQLFSAWLFRARNVPGTRETLEHGHEHGCAACSRQWTPLSGTRVLMEREHRPPGAQCGPGEGRGAASPQEAPGSSPGKAPGLPEAAAWAATQAGHASTHLARPSRRPPRHPLHTHSPPRLIHPPPCACTTPNPTLFFSAPLPALHPNTDCGGFLFASPDSNGAPEGWDLGLCPAWLTGMSLSTQGHSLTAAGIT